MREVALRKAKICVIHGQGQVIFSFLAVTLSAATSVHQPAIVQFILMLNGAGHGWSVALLSLHGCLLAVLL